MLVIVLELMLAVVSAENSLSSSHGCPHGASCGKTLFLTPYLLENRTSEARKDAKVESFIPTQPQITSYSGYVTVNPDYNSNLFFWLFPSLKEPTTAPIVLWLGGYPGAAISSKVFFKNGPYVVTHRRCSPTSLSPAFYHWSEIMHTVYIDSPVGAGFSFTKNPLGLANSTEDVVRDLYSAVSQIIQIFPEYQNNDFFISGESYSAKYVISLAHLIHVKNQGASKKLNLKGVAIGDGWLDPSSMLKYSQVLFSIGMIDSQTRDEFSTVENTIDLLITKNSYSEAFDVMEHYFPVKLHRKSYSLFENKTGFSYSGNYLRIDNEVEDAYSKEVVKFINQPGIRKKLHVGGQKFTMINEEVFERLKSDLLRSIVPQLEVVMNNYRVVMYNGQLDITSANRLTANLLCKLHWRGAQEYERAERKKWFVEGEFAGYVKTVGSFCEILVRNAGINVIEDQPLWAWDLMKRFTQSSPFS